MSKKKTKSGEPEKKVLASYTVKLDDAQMDKLDAYCDHHIWEKFDVDHARFAYKHKLKKVNVTAYKSGKVVIAGKGTEEFVVDVLEAEITMDPRLGYEEVHNPEYFEAHAGMDEAGKGDLFGPLVTACVIASPEAIRGWRKDGVRDSKSITDSRIGQLDKKVRATDGVVIEVAYCSMERYNELMAKPGANLNKLLAWLHAKALVKALAKKRVPWGMLDQFSKRNLVGQYFKDKEFDLRMQTKAEADPVVAAASIVARAEFLRHMKKLSEQAGEELLKGASRMAKDQGKRLVEKMGPEALGKFAKLHFKTSKEILGLPVEKKPYFRRSSG